jgi:hypothetical protein
MNDSTSIVLLQSGNKTNLKTLIKRLGVQNVVDGWGSNHQLDIDGIRDKNKEKVVKNLIKKFNVPEAAAKKIGAYYIQHGTSRFLSQFRKDGKLRSFYTKKGKNEFLQEEILRISGQNPLIKATKKRTQIRKLRKLRAAAGVIKQLPSTIGAVDPITLEPISSFFNSMVIWPNYKAGAKTLYHRNTLEKGNFRTVLNKLFLIQIDPTDKMLRQSFKDFSDNVKCSLPENFNKNKFDDFSLDKVDDPEGGEPFYHLHGIVYEKFNNGNFVLTSPLTRRKFSSNNMLPSMTIRNLTNKHEYNKNPANFLKKLFPKK